MVLSNPWNRLQNTPLISPSAAIFAPEQNIEILRILRSTDRCAENIPVNRQHNYTHAKESASQKTLTNTVAAMQCYSLSENSNMLVNIFLSKFEHFRIF